MKASTFYLILIGAWLVLLIPTILYWKESIVFLVFLSWYANFASDVNNYRIAKMSEKMEGER